MAIAITLHGFNNLGRSVTPIFLSMDHFFYRFSTFCEKMKKVYRVEVWIFFKTLHWNPFIWPLPLSVRQFQMPLQGLRFMKMMSIFKIISATDSLIQNITSIVFNLKTLETMLNYAHQFIKIKLCFLHALSLKRSQWSPIFISFLKQVNPCPSAVEVLSSRKFSRERP